MNLREAFDSIPVKRSGRPCLTCVTLSQMSADDASTLRDLLDSDASTRMIFEACRAAGYDSLTLSALKRHRSGVCLGLP